MTVTEPAEAGRVKDVAPVSPSSATLPGRWRRRWRNDWVVVTSIVVVTATWELAGRITESLFLPPLTAIASRLIELFADGTIPRQLGASLLALMAGMAVAVVAGVVIGALMGLFRSVEEALDVYINAMMAAPMVAFVPVFIMVFGLGYATRIVLVILFAFFPIVINTYAGFRRADPDLIHMAQSFGATRRQVIREIRVPTAHEHIQAGLRLGMARGVDGLITGEVLITAVGLGGLVSRFGSAFTMDRLWAIVFVIIVLALLSVRLTTWLSRAVVSRSS